MELTSRILILVRACVSPVADIDIVTSDFGVVAVILNPILGLFN